MATKTEIENSEFFKSLSKLSNSERGSLFEQHSARIEKALNVKLVKHSYRDLSNINPDSLKIAYQENWGSFTGPIIGIMEFQVQE